MDPKTLAFDLELEIEELEPKIAPGKIDAVLRQSTIRTEAEPPRLRTTVRTPQTTRTPQEAARAARATVVVAAAAAAGSSHFLPSRKREKARVEPRAFSRFGACFPSSLLS